jgi:hypothetical protein
MSAAVQNWSAFVREPTSVLPKLERGGSVVLNRRDGEPLVITTKSQADSSHLGTELAAMVILQAMATAQSSLKEAVSGLMSSRFPWLRLLPLDSREMFLKEFFETVEACASVGNMSRLSELVGDWKATAEVHSDSDLVLRLAQPITQPVGRLVLAPSATFEGSAKKVKSTNGSTGSKAAVHHGKAKKKQSSVRGKTR